MKKSVLSIVVIFSILFCSCGNNKSEQSKSNAKVKKIEISVEKDNYKPGEKDALIVLKAYADEDLETLKSYASGTQKMVMDDEYFKTNKNVISFREKLSYWNGSFKEVRYYEEEKNFQNYYYATAVFYESTSGQYTAVKLKSTDKENWKLAGFGTAYLKNQEFSEMSLEIPE
jgi:hypothetical protein